MSFNCLEIKLASGAVVLRLLSLHVHLRGVQSVEHVQKLFLLINYADL